jgi:hypothetical protein
MYLQGGRYGAARVLGPATVAAMTRNQIEGIPFEYEGERWPRRGASTITGSAGRTCGSIWSGRWWG